MPEAIIVSKDSYHSSEFRVLVAVAFTNKENRQRSKQSKHNILVSVEVAVCE